MNNQLRNERDLQELSNELSDYIISNYENKLIKKIITSDYGHFLPFEQEAIYELSLGNKPECRDLICDKMEKYLRDNDKIIIDGFIHFRLKEYKLRLSEAVNRSVEEFEVKKEYDNFVNLIRYFIDMQIPLYSMVHLCVEDCETITILNDKKVKVAQESNPDLLLDTIISIAPNRIYLHKPEDFVNEELINTIMCIFSGKITVCNGCGICGKIQ